MPLQPECLSYNFLLYPQDGLFFASSV